MIGARPGLPQGLVIPASELVERFSRSTGPGGQGVNTSDSRVELLFDVAASKVLSAAQRTSLLEFLGDRLVDGGVHVTASEHRSQLRNRAAARQRLTRIIVEALAPPPLPRKATRPTRGSQQRRLDTKRRRSEVKSTRGRMGRHHDAM